MCSTEGLCWGLEWTSRGSVQFKTVYMRTGKPICAPLHFRSFSSVAFEI